MPEQMHERGCMPEYWWVHSVHRRSDARRGHHGSGHGIAVRRVAVGILVGAGRNVGLGVGWHHHGSVSEIKDSAQTLLRVLRIMFWNNGWSRHVSNVGTSCGETLYSSSNTAFSRSYGYFGVY